MNRPKRTSLLLPLLFLLVVALSMGAAPLSAYEEGPDSLEPTLSVALEGTALKGATLDEPALEGTALEEPAFEAAADASAPIEVTNETRTIASGLAVSNNRFAVKATGTGEGGVAAVEVKGDLANTTANEGQSSDPLFATLIAYGLGAGAVNARVNGGMSIAPSSVAQNPKEFCSIFNKV
ncbi:MAG: hypothetical protein IKG18_10480 [Atopobiaceae bacterium]|nr:hypothetical protein [Atopobiaceae bacterium]